MTEKLFVLDDDRYNTISKATCNLYSLLCILEIYSENKGVRNQEIANIYILVSIMLEEIRKISACI